MITQIGNSFRMTLLLAGAVARAQSLAPAAPEAPAPPMPPHAATRVAPAAPAAWQEPTVASDPALAPVAPVSAGRWRAALLSPTPPAPPEAAPALAMWQEAPVPPTPALPPSPAPAALPAVQAAPAPHPAPAPAIAPLPPTPPDQDWNEFSSRVTIEQQEKIEKAVEKAREAFEKTQDKFVVDQDKIQMAIDEAGQKLATIKPFNFDFNFDMNLPLLAQQNRVLTNFRVGKGGNADGLYERGRRELDQHYWDQAVTDFTEVAGRAGNHADGALYWKAYALNKLGRRDEALASIAELRKSYAGSRWLDDANALEVEVKQGSGSSVAPDGQNDDEIKLLALNGLMQSEPDRAYPYLEKLLQSANTPHLKEQALFVLAQSSSPKAQELLGKIARGGGNPDLQLTAIRYMSAVNRRRGNNNQALFEIYNSSNDAAVKREILNALAGSRDRDHLMQIARNEKTKELRMDAIRMLGSMNSQPPTSDALLELYGPEQDKDVKREIVNVLAGQRNAKALVDLGRKEKDMELKKDIVRRLVDMNTPESRQFLEEILK